MPLTFSASFAALPRSGVPEADSSRRANIPLDEDAEAAASATVARVVAETAARSQPRLITHSALAALKALGPRLTPAQRRSIDMLEGYEKKRVSAHVNAGLFEDDHDLWNLPGPHVTLMRRPSFLLAAPALADLDATVTRDPDGMSEFKPAPVRALLTAQAAVAHEVIQTVKHRAVDEARAGLRVCPLTLEGERFDSFLKENIDILQQVISACEEPEDTDLLESELTRLAERYLAARNIVIDARTGMPAEPGSAGPDPTTVLVNLANGHDMPGQFVAGEENDKCYVITIQCDGIAAMAQRPGNLSLSGFGLTGDFVVCEPHERAASMYLQHLFYQLADAEQFAAVTAGTPEQTDANEATSNSMFEAMYIGDEDVGDGVCVHEDGQTQRERGLEPLADLRRMAVTHENDREQPLLTVPALNDWISGIDFENDLACLSNPRDRLERAQVGAVAEALRASGAFMTLPNRR